MMVIWSLVIGHWSLGLRPSFGSHSAAPSLVIRPWTFDLGLWTLASLPDSKGLHLSEESFVICLEISGSGALISM